MYVAPPGAVLDQISDMSLIWVAATVAFELASCLGYVFVFRRLFPEPSASPARRVAWIGMGAGAVLPGGNFCSAAATGWLLRRSGLSHRQLLTRCSTLVCLLIAVNLVAAVSCGLLLLGHLVSGPHDLEHTAIPTAVCAGLLLLMWACGALIRLRGERPPRFVQAIGEGVDGAWKAVGRAHWRLLGAAAYVCFDMAALWAACSATGHPVGFPAVVLAYEIGYLATLIPIPAGVGVLDTGLVATLVLYGERPSAAIGAVLVYHAIAIWVPGLGGFAAWLPGRRARRIAEVGSLGIVVPAPTGQPAA
jgi:uncharacterized membrane protein YbhN (UPF0104 family)